MNSDFFFVQRIKRGLLSNFDDWRDESLLRDFGAYYIVKIMTLQKTNTD